jgi:hypothetical protein
VPFGTLRRYFVVAEVTADGGSQTPNQFRVTHITASSSTAEDADHDIPLVLEFADNVASGIVTAADALYLTVTRSGSGGGIVTSEPSGIHCGSACSAPFGSGTEVTLSATAAAGSHFVGWSGDPDCSDGLVTLGADKSCNAIFDLIRPEDDLYLHDRVVYWDEVYPACRSITATEFTVASPGDTTFRAGEYVVLGDGFLVEEGCRFTVEIQSPIGCP